MRRLFEVSSFHKELDMAQQLVVEGTPADVPVRTLWVEKYEPTDRPPRGTVVFVDDLLFNLGWFVRMVKKWLPDVAAYGTLFQFDPILVYSHQPFDVLIADVILPKQRATVWLRPYKEFLLDRGVAIVFTSALPEKDFWTVAEVDGWQQDELCYYIEKPWDRDRFVTIINHCLDRRSEETNDHRHNKQETRTGRGGSESPS